MGKVLDAEGTAWIECDGLLEVLSNAGFGAVRQ